MVIDCYLKCDEPSPYGKLTCPKCGKMFRARWSTEYGNEFDGVHSVYFPCCNQYSIIEVQTGDTAYQSKEEE